MPPGTDTRDWTAGRLRRRAPATARSLGVLLLGVLLLCGGFAGTTAGTGVASAPPADTCVSVATFDADGNDHETTVAFERIDGDLTKVAETDEDSGPAGCMNEDQDNSYIFELPAGEYHAHVINNGNERRWGLYRVTIPDTDEETLVFERGAVYHTDADVSSPRDSRRFEPGEDAEFEARLYNDNPSGWNSGTSDPVEVERVTPKVYVYPNGASRPDRPTKRLSAESVSGGRHESIRDSIPIPDETGTYRVAAQLVTEFEGYGRDYTTDYVDLGTIEVASFEPPRIESRSPGSGGPSIGPEDETTFSVDVTDPDSTPSVTWYVDGQRAGSGQQYRFAAERFGDGDHRVRAVASDDTDSTDDAVAEWTVDVAEAPELTDVRPGSTETIPGRTVELAASGDSSDLSYEWTIDGESVSGPDVETTFESTGEKQVRVVAENRRGISTERSFTIDVKPRPPSVGEVTVSPSSLTAGEEINLSASATDTTDRDVDLSYEWTVGDETYDGETVSTTLRTVGSRDIDLTVTNQFGASITRTRTVEVENDDPELERVSPEEFPTPKSGVEQRFVASVTDADASPETVKWSVDGEVVAERKASSGSQRVTFSHAFSSPGDHTVEATVEDGHGGQETISWEVRAANRAPELSVESPDSSSLSLLSGSSKAFEVAASDPEGDAVSYRWYFDGEEVATGERLNRTFVGSGTRNVTVVAEDANGGTDRESWSVAVRNFRKRPEVESAATIQRLDRNGSQEFITLSLRNPDVNSRTAHVELALSPPNGIEVNGGRNVEEGSMAEYVNEAVVRPGESASLSVGVAIGDDSLWGQRIEIPYQVVYYPEGSRDSYRVVENATKEIFVGDEAALAAANESDAESDSQGATGIDGSVPGFTPALTLLALGLGVLRARR
ncbi:PKD domain-containing protein [Halorussus pelagicus]|uniref:PKD domain-containing protein n=1 Tax=Halorussus pelagicus TaxID=2505977 RepID=UPI000FFBB4EF|nr:PKD domain-containing protein [Halorussus pelagicus]